MKAFVYRGPGLRVLEERPKPQLLDPGDAIVRITKTTICGTDLRILKGDIPSCEPGRILGHEGVGVIDAVGAAVTRFKPGDRVLISCITSCGKCDACRRRLYSHCESGGWLLGHRIDGTQAEFVRTPHADTSLYPLPYGVEEEPFVMLSDILPAGLECGVINGRVQPGSTVAIVGAGPIGISALMTAQFYTPAEIIVVDVDDNRLEVARGLGATATVNSRDGKAAHTIRKLLTSGRGVDTAIEAVGVPESFELCQQIVGHGGTIAAVGIHGSPATLHLEKLWKANVTITIRMVDTVTTPMLLRTLETRTIEPERLITHRFNFTQMIEAYDTFGNAAETKALKVIVSMH